MKLYFYSTASKFLDLALSLLVCAATWTSGMSAFWVVVLLPRLSSPGPAPGPLITMPADLRGLAMTFKWERSFWWPFYLGLCLDTNCSRSTCSLRIFASSICRLLS